MSIKNGDMPAMPMVTLTEESQYNGMKYVEAKNTYTGLTKREQFAMAMAQGLCATGQYASFDHVAEDAVKAADKLLAELERTK